MNKYASKGFTLIELVMVTAIVAVLAGVAYPSYQQAVRDSRRAEVVTVLHRIALRQERWRARRAAYATSIAALCDCGSNNAFDNEYYTITVVTADASGFQLRAEAKTGTTQIADRAGGTSCARLSLTVGASSAKTPAACYSK